MGYKNIEERRKHNREAREKERAQLRALREYKKVLHSENPSDEQLEEAFKKMMET
jgi:hypothetical protein